MKPSPGRLKNVHVAWQKSIKHLCSYRNMLKHAIMGHKKGRLHEESGQLFPE